MGTQCVYICDRNKSVNEGENMIGQKIVYSLQTIAKIYWSLLQYNKTVHLLIFSLKFG